METDPFWTHSIEETFLRVGSRKEGLSGKEAQEKLKQEEKYRLHPAGRGKSVILLFSQFKSPLILLLLFAAILSFFFGGKVDALIIMAIIVLSAALSFFQERGAINTLETLLQRVEIKANVFRDGKEIEIPMHEVVSGDVVRLVAGDIIPGDCLIIKANHLFVDESMLTGESAAAEKMVGQVSKEANALFFGTHVLNGNGLALIVATGNKTMFGEIQERVRFKPPETAFEKGVQKFGLLLLVVTLILVTVIFSVNLFLGRPILESLLFSLAIAVGLTPQLLPAIISVNLSRGAGKMAKKQVIVKRLASIENFGLMNVLCCDKTGTVTEGKMSFEQAVDPLGGASDKCLLFGRLNAHFQASYPNPLDQVLQQIKGEDFNGWKKLDEIPYDFSRRRLSVIVEKEASPILIAKGAVPEMLSISSSIEWKGGDREELSIERREEIERYFEEMAGQGLRTLAVGYAEGREEKDLCLLGFLTFCDPIKKDIGEVVSKLKAKGIQLKIITGDHHLVALHVAGFLGLTRAHLLTGQEIAKIDEAHFLNAIRDKNVFAEIEPNQKEKIILALRKEGHVVGFLGDGVNDVSALHSADVSISVDTGADAAKEASDFVLLNKDLSVLQAGVEEGRTTFANTIKYVYMATSANFGNMFSMAGASLILNFLPLLPKQVLLTNLLTDFPEMAIAGDLVDPDLVHRPVKWDLKFIAKFMLVFGLISSIFDYLTFGILLYWMGASEDQFRTGWFVESVASAAIVVLIIRTRHWFFFSRPGNVLTIAVGCVVLAAALLPLTPLNTFLGFVPLPLWFYGVVFAIVIAYLILVELSKRIFFRKRKALNGKK